MATFLIGDDSILTKDIPHNCISVGNPAKVDRHLDPNVRIKTQAEWFAFRDQLALHQQGLDRRMLKGNHLLDWMRSVFLPALGD